MIYVSGITQKGLVLIPVNLRNQYGLFPMGNAVIEAVDNGVLVRPAPTTKQMQGFMKTEKRFSEKQLKKAIEEYDYS